MRTFAAFVLLLLCVAAPLRAETRVRIVETWPAGEDVVLGRQQSFHLRIAYSTDAPTHVWARPYLRGEPARAGSNPSLLLEGEGETIGWFFLMTPEDEVDEVRIETGDGRPGSTAVGATWRGRVRGSQVAATGDAPAWVARLKDDMETRARAAREAAHASEDLRGVGVAMAGFLLAVLAVGLGGFVASGWALARWRGGWRIAAALPAAWLAFVVLRFVVDVARDPTSHNLWPFELVVHGGLVLGAIGLLALVRAIARRRVA